MPPARPSASVGAGRVLEERPALSGATRAARARPRAARPRCARRGRPRLDRGGHAGDEAAAAHGHHDRADVGQLLQDLEGRPCPGRRRCAGRRRRGRRWRPCAPRGPWPRAWPRRRRSAPPSRTVTGNVRSFSTFARGAVCGHEERGRHVAAQGLRGEGHAERVVARGGRHHAARAAAPRTSEASRFEGAPHLEGARGLPALELQPGLAAPAARRSGAAAWAGGGRAMRAPRVLDVREASAGACTRVTGAPGPPPPGRAAARRSARRWLGHAVAQRDHGAPAVALGRRWARRSRGGSVPAAGARLPSRSTRACPRRASGTTERPSPPRS